MYAHKKSPRKQRVRGGLRTHVDFGSDWTVRRTSLCAVPFTTERRSSNSAGLHASVVTSDPQRRLASERSRCRSCQPVAFGRSAWPVVSAKGGGKIGQRFAGVKAEFLGAKIRFHG